MAKRTDSFVANVPEDLEQYYEKLLQDSQRFVEIPKDQFERYQKSHKTLYDVQVELSSISHERSVLERLTKEISQKMKTIQSAETISPRGFSYQRPTGGTPAPSREAKVDLDKPIPIPEYVPPYKKQISRIMSSKETERKHQFGYNPANVRVKNTANTVVVPSLKQGDQLPAYLANLKGIPVQNSLKGKRKKKSKSVGFNNQMGIDPLMNQRFHRTEQELTKLKQQLARTNNKISKEKNKSIEKLRLLVQAMEEKQLWKDQTLLETVDQLIEEAIYSFQDVVDETELIAIIEDILTHFPTPNIREVRSSELFTIPEEDESPYDRSNEAEDIHYTVVHLPSKKEEKKEVEKEEVAIQTTLIEEESPQVQIKDPELPREVLPPVVPQIIIQQTLPPSQQTPITVAPDSTEREQALMELIRTIISTQEKTMQGQQALLLTLLQQQIKDAVAPNPPEKEEESYGESEFEEVPPPSPPPPAIIEVEEKKEIEMKEEEIIQEEVQVIQGEVELPPFIKEEKKKVHYNTCFGEFLLSGKQLYGKYAVPERLPFKEYLKQLEEEGDGSNRHNNATVAIEEPRLRRRASPLTMKLLFPTNPPAKTNTKPHPLSASFDQASNPNSDGFIQFANKLLDTLSQPRNRSDEEKEAAVSKKEITKAVHDGIASGIKQVLGYFPDSKSKQAKDEEEGAKKRVPYFQEMWTRKESNRREKAERDPLQPLIIMKEIEKSKSSYHQLVKPETKNDDDEMNSVEYNDSISLSEGYDAFNDDVDDPVSHVRQTNRKKASIMTRFINSAIGDDVEDEEASVKEYFASDIHYDSKDSDVEKVHESAVQGKVAARPREEPVQSDRDPTVALPPLVSSLLEQQETKKVIYQQKLVSKPRRQRSSSASSRSSEGEVRDSAIKETIHLSDNDDDDDALISLELSEESRQIEKRARRRPSRYDTTNEEEESYPSEDDSDVQYHHDHRIQQHRPAKRGTTPFIGDDSFSSASSASPSRYHHSMMSEEDAENLSIATAEDSLPFGTVRRHNAEETMSIAHKTRYSLSEVRMKRKDLLNSWNHKRKKSSFAVNYEPQSTGLEGRREEEKERKEVNVSISEEEEEEGRRREERSYNSLLSSEESSIMSERLKLLRKKNRRWIDKFKEKTALERKEDKHSSGSREGEGEGEGEGERKERSGRSFYPPSDSVSNSEMDFSVNTPLSNSSDVSDTPRVTSNRLIGRSAKGGERGRGNGNGGNGGGGVNVSIPLLNIDVRQYSNRPRWH